MTLNGNVGKLATAACKERNRLYLGRNNMNVHDGILLKVGSTVYILMSELIFILKLNLLPTDNCFLTCIKTNRVETY